MRRRLSLLLACGLLPLFVVCCADAARKHGERVIFHEKSEYQDIYVVRKGTVVSLKFGTPQAPVIQSQVDLSNLRRHMLEYSRLAFAGLLYQPRPKRILVVGLGGGVIPRELHHYYPRATIEVVEIDPLIPRVARRFFRFPKVPQIEVYVDDGRAFIEKRAEQSDGAEYDLIVLDAYGEGSIPFHLLTRQFLRTVKSIRASDGAIVSNLIRTHRLFDSELKTYRAVFRSTQAYEGTESTNVILVAPGKDAPVLSREDAYRRARLLQEQREFTFSLPEVAGHLNPTLKSGEDAVVLTDSMAQQESNQSGDMSEGTRRTP